LLTSDSVVGYLVGDRIVADAAAVDPDPTRVGTCSERVHLLEEGLDRFTRVRAARLFEDGPLIYFQQEMPLGPEDEVLQAFLERASSVDAVKGVSPALDAAFRMEVRRCEEADRRRMELERLRKEEEAQRQLEERRRALATQLGDGAKRRALARFDFEAAARAALLVGGAELLDAQLARGEWTVKYRLDGRRYACVCDGQMQIIDSGICLTDHTTGVKGDTWYTLESLPTVVRQADREGRLVVYRNV
jgi:hypothetical protein